MADPTELQPLQEDGQAPALARSLPPFGVRVGRSLWNAFREMPWPTRACASWLVLIVTAAIFADWIPRPAGPPTTRASCSARARPSTPVHGALAGHRQRQP